jgi:hypothetical protein
MKRAPLTPIRLTEIPFSTRMSAARRECQQATDDSEREEIMFAALFPSDKLYWVRADEPLRAAA